METEEPAQITQFKDFGENAAVHIFDPSNKEDMAALGELRTSPYVMRWMIGKPKDFSNIEQLNSYVHTTPIKEWRGRDEEKIMYAVKGSENVAENEVGKLQGFVSFYNVEEQIVERLIEAEMLPESVLHDTSNTGQKLPIVEVSYARKTEAQKRQLAGSLRTALMDLSKQLAEENFDVVENRDNEQKPPKEQPHRLRVMGFIDPKNIDSRNVLQASGFEKKGDIEYEPGAEMKDEVWELNWDKLYDIVSNKITAGLSAN